MSDVRLIGFGSRAPLRDAMAWVDAHAAALPTELVALDGAAGRMLAMPVPSPVDWPGVHCAATDGYAVQAAETEGASEYNPLPVQRYEFTAAGQPMPAGTDAILPFAGAQPGGALLDALAPIVRGTGVVRQGSGLRAGSLAVAAGTLRPQALALLLGLGVERVAVVRRPRIGLVVAGPKSGPDLLTPMLQALVARDGGIADTMPLQAAGADLILMAGRSGAGPDDEAPQVLANAGGALDMHGIAVRPGDSTGLGRIGGTPVLLLPGAPHACLTIYDLLAARAIRSMAAAQPADPYASVERVLDRKAVSAVGFTDVIPVRVSDAHATPLGLADTGTLARAAQADGFIVIPETSEGFPPGATVRVHIY